MAHASSLRHSPDEADAGGSRERILDAAERLVGQRGYTAASISMISRESGLSASSIYWFFGSKEDLLAAVVERGVERWLRDQPALGANGGSLADLLDASSRTVASHPDFLRLLFMIILDGREGPPKARAALHAAWSGVERRIEHAMARHYGLSGAAGVALAARLARFTIAFFDGVFLDSQIDPEGTRLADLLADLKVALEAIAWAGRNHP